MPKKQGIDLFKPAASNYVLFEDAERFMQEPAIRDDRPDPRYPDPTSVYLVYLQFDSSGQLKVRQLQADFGNATLKTTEAALFNAAADPKSKAGYTNFEDMVWDKPTYVTFVIHNPGWKFYWRQDDRRHNPIRFFRRKDTIPRTTDTYQENHAFFEGRLFDLDDGNGGKHKAFRCINFVTDEKGRLGRGQVRRYCFQIYLEAPFLLPGGSTRSERHITVLIDPDGQNQGPPVRYRRRG